MLVHPSVVRFLEERKKLQIGHVLLYPATILQQSPLGTPTLQFWTLGTLSTKVSNQNMKIQQKTTF